MRCITLIIIMLTCLNAYAQRINGIVIDKQTRQLISGAVVTTAKSKALSDLHGQFLIEAKTTGDTIRVSMDGYKPYQIPVSTGTESIVIELEKQVIELRQVDITAKRNRVDDSISNRKMYAKGFNASAPKFKDIVSVSMVPGLIPVAGVTIIPSELIRAITYKGSREYKFKRTLVQDENDRYIDSRFSKTLITELTRLQADSLLDFMDSYRPTAATIRKMTDYDLRICIKNSATAFRTGKSARP